MMAPMPEKRTRNASKKPSDVSCAFAAVSAPGIFLNSALNVLTAPRNAGIAGSRSVAIVEVTDDFNESIVPAMVSFWAAMIPPILAVAPANPVVPFSMPFTNESMANFESTDPLLMRFDISSAETPAVLAKIFKAGTPTAWND